LSNPITEHTSSVIGLPYPTSYVPGLTLSGYSDKMSIFERFNNFFFQLASYYLSFEEYDSLTLIMRKHFGQGFPDIRQIVRDSPFILVNADEFVDFPRPLFSNIIYIGGIDEIDNKLNKSFPQLPEQLNLEMKKGNKGIILFSVGTVICSKELPKSFIFNLFETFKQIKDYHFILKMDVKDKFYYYLKGHPRIKLFITHSGYNSLLEAAKSGVPVLSIPFFLDQFRNARIPERNGWGINFDKRLLLKSSNEFKDAIINILEDKRFKLNAERTKKLIMTKPFSSEQRLLASFKFLEQNGGNMKELLPESRNLSTIELYNLDIIFLIIICLVFVFLTIFISFQIILILLRKSLKKGDKKYIENKIIKKIQ
ncbi:hypothetical protein Mgra_00007607, partial [Meloidogyne graminicola]